MKHLISFLLILLCTSSFALECIGGSGLLRFTWEGDGTLRLFLKDAQEPLLEIVPALQGEIKAEIVPRGWLKYDILSLRSAECSLGIKIERNRPAFAISVNRNASPVEIHWNPQAIVLPDFFGEDIILEAASQERPLPAFLPAYMALIKGENATVTVIPSQANQDAILSADMKQLSLYQENSEDYNFFVNTAAGIWHQASLPANEGDSRVVEDWTPPYPALWKASIPMELDFLASGDGSRASWGIATIDQREDGSPTPCDLSTRCVMTNMSSRQTWLGGFEGNFRYPAEFQDGKVLLFNPRFQNRDRVKASTNKAVYFYAFQENAQTPKDVILPWSIIPAWIHRYHFSSNTIGSTPATCTVTEIVEKIFYKGESQEKATEIHQQLESMQFFVEGIRGRIENVRVWRKKMLNEAERACRADAILGAERDKLAEILQDVEVLYEAALPVIQTPDVVEGYSRQINELANSDEDDDEKEDAAKALGRLIRTIGGGQDNLNAKMRHILKNLRFQAMQNYMTAQTPEAKAFWGNAYREAEPLLQGYFGHDGK